MKLLILSLVLSFLCIGFLYAQSTASKQITSIKLKSSQLEVTKKVWIYTPKNYRKSEKRYPVIYMFDAQNLFDAKTSYAGEWQIDEYLDSLSIEKTEVIVVGIEHGNDKRIEELTPYQHEKHGGGKGDKFLEFIIKEVKPKIDRKFRTEPQAQHTTIFGSSLGGLMALYATVKYPETFSRAGIFSPAFWINPEIYDFVESSKIPATTKFYLMAGDSESEEMVPDMNKMINLLKKKGVNENHMKSKVVEKGEHNEKLWRENFPEAFEWLMK